MFVLIFRLGQNTRKYPERKVQASICCVSIRFDFYPFLSENWEILVLIFSVGQSTRKYLECKIQYSICWPLIRFDFNLFLIRILSFWNSCTYIHASWNYSKIMKMQNTTAYVFYIDTLRFYAFLVEKIWILILKNREIPLLIFKPGQNIKKYWKYKTQNPEC